MVALNKSLSSGAKVKDVRCLLFMRSGTRFKKINTTKIAKECTTFCRLRKCNQ